MKLVLIGLTTSTIYASTTATSGVSNVASTCGGSEAVEISFSYSNDQIQDMSVGEAKVGTCSGADVTTSYDENSSTHTFSVSNIYDCGIPDNRNPSNISSYGYDMEIGFDAMKVSQGMNLAFESASFQVGCDLENSYMTSYSFHDGLEMESQDDGEIDDGLGSVSFETESFTDATFTVVRPNGTDFEAGQKAYLQVSPIGVDLTQFEYRVSSCEVADTRTNQTYMLYDYNNNVCDNEHLDLSVEMTGYGKAQISYQLFLFRNNPDDANYVINCSIDFCRIDNDASQCKIVDANCPMEGSGGFGQ